MARGIPIPGAVGYRDAPAEKISGVLWRDPWKECILVHFIIYVLFYAFMWRGYNFINIGVEDKTEMDDQSSSPPTHFNRLENRL